MFDRHNRCVSAHIRAMGIAAPSLYAAFGDKRTLFPDTPTGWN